MENNKRPSQSEWELLIQEQSATKSTISKFCKERGLSIHNFRYWRDKLSGSPMMPKPEPKFSKVKVSPEPINQDFKVELSLGRIILVGPRLPTPTWLAELNRELLN